MSINTVVTKTILSPSCQRYEMCNSIIYGNLYRIVTFIFNLNFRIISRNNGTRRQLIYNKNKKRITVFFLFHSLRFSFQVYHVSKKKKKKKMFSNINHLNQDTLYIRLMDQEFFFSFIFIVQS